MKLVQYVGDGYKGAKVCIDITQTYATPVLGSEDFHKDYKPLDLKSEMLLKTIQEEDYEKHIKASERCFRYVLRQVKDVWIASEEYRDAYDFHVPGFYIINNLKVGDMFSLNGFKSQHEFLSEGDKALLAGADLWHFEHDD
jgi:hypothetical protein